MRVWITKRALSDGIVVAKGELMGHCIELDRPVFGQIFYSPTDFFYTEEEAITRAEQLRENRIAGYKRSIAKLEKLSFTTNKE